MPADVGSDRHLVRLAERDLIRDRFPFFVAVWLATSFVWLYALATGSAPLLGWQGALAIGTAGLVVLLPALRWVGGTSSPRLTQSTSLGR